MSIYEHTDSAVVCENERYLQLCRVLPGLGRAPLRALRLGQERPSLSSINSAISGNLAPRSGAT